MNINIALTALVTHGREDSERSDGARVFSALSPGDGASWRAGVFLHTLLRCFQVNELKGLRIIKVTVTQLSLYFCINTAILRLQETRNENGGL